MLGPLEVAGGSGPARLGGPKQRMVLAHLVLRAGRVVPTDRLIDLVWGEDPPRAVRNVLQTYVSRLRRVLGPERLEGRSGGYVLRADPSEIDAHRFEALIEGARAAGDVAAAVRNYRDALGLWRGSPLADLADQASLLGEVARLEGVRLAAVEDLMQAELALGRHGEVLAELQRLVAEHPLREELHSHLMLALYRSGRQAEALEAYRAARETLVDELGIEPGPALRELEQAILRQDPSLDPPARTAEPPAHNLPAQVTSFVGRRREIEEVAELLDGARLVTLTGPGGCGKTRLALEVASDQVPRFRDGVFLVSLAALRDASLIVPAIARTLGVKERTDEPVAETVREHLAFREALLVLDNYEHLLEGAPEVTRLLEGAPRVKALATSREILRLSGEHEFPVPPLALPDPGAIPAAEALAELDSTALFLQRARMAVPRFEMTEANAGPIAAICLRLDGLPLAIELAASMVRTFDPPALLDRLEDALEVLTEGPRDVPDRQRTLRGTIAWSYDLLPEEERRLFRGMGVFLRGATTAAAREVLDADAGLPERMGSLVEKNLLLREADGEVRFRMLETIRELARAELEACGELPDLARRHAAWFLRAAEEAEPHLLGSEQAVWLDRLEGDHDNLRAALRRSIDAGDAETGMRLGAALWRFWLLRGHLREGRRWLERALELGGAERPTRAKALTALGGLAYWQDDYRAAGRAYREALDLCRELGDEAGEAAALYNLGYIALIEDDLDEAWSLFTAARERHRRLGDRAAYASDGLGLGLVGSHRRDWEAATEVLEETEGLYREVGDRFGLGSTLVSLVVPYRERGELDRAERAGREALAIYREAGDLAGVAMVLGSIATLRVARGEVETGVRLAGAAHAIEEEIGGGVPSGVRTYEDARTLAEGLLEPEVIARAWEAGRSLSIDEAAAEMLGAEA